MLIPFATTVGPHDLPNTVGEWMDFYNLGLPKLDMGTQNVLGHIPNELYIASGSQGQSVLAQLLHRSAQEGPPFAWRGGLMWVPPPSPYYHSHP